MAFGYFGSLRPTSCDIVKTYKEPLNYGKFLQFNNVVRPATIIVP